MAKEFKDPYTLEDSLREINADEDSGAKIAVKELTSEAKRKDTEEARMTNMDFKSRLTLPEISAHACLEWLNQVLTEKELFTKELRIVHLVSKMKRLRVSEEGKAREGLEKVFTATKKDDEQSMWQKFLSPRNPL